MGEMPFTKNVKFSVHGNICAAAAYKSTNGQTDFFDKGRVGGGICRAVRNLSNRAITFFEGLSSVSSKGAGDGYGRNS